MTGARRIGLVEADATEAEFGPAWPAHSGETVVIVGAGFSGSMVARHLLDSASRRPRHVVLIDRGGRFGPGLAYGTRCPRHLLNVPAGAMSALPEEPGHFLEWARRRDPQVGGGGFLPRAWYGEYIESILADAQRAAGAGTRLTCLADAAVGISPHADRIAVTLESGWRLSACRVVLALGNRAPSAPCPLDSLLHTDRRYIGDPWQPGVVDRVAEDDRVLILGTGLTMLDLVMELDSRGHRGRVTAVSRRGLLPHAHRTPPHPPTEPIAAPDAWPVTALGVLRAFRALTADALRDGRDWRDVVAMLRPHTQEIWANLAPCERDRFLRTLRPYWEIHRHRVPAAIHERAAALARCGRLTVRAATLIGLRPSGAGIIAEIRPHGLDTRETVRAEIAINCTGPDSDLRRSMDPIVASLEARGLISHDQLGLGIRTSADGALIGADEQASRTLYTIGPPCKPRLWETTAVPELRVQAMALAKTLADSMGAARPSVPSLERSR